MGELQRGEDLPTSLRSKLIVKGIKIFFEVFTEFQHSKFIIKPKFKLQHYLALQRDNLPESVFYKKI